MKINNDNVSKTPNSDASSRLIEKISHIRNRKTVSNNSASTSDESISNDNADSRKKWFMIGAGALFVVVAFGIGHIFTSQSRLHDPKKDTLVAIQSSANSTNKKDSTTNTNTDIKSNSTNETESTTSTDTDIKDNSTTKKESTTSTDTDIKSVDPYKEIKENLETVAKATGQPYKISTSEIGGNYILGVITYYPDDSEKTYMDYSITAPDKPLAPDNDMNALKIEYKLYTSLPTINNTITVIDASKVTMATYKQNDSYNTILLYDGKPFGYVTTDKDGNMVNTVTSYYIQNVQKNN